MAFATSDYYQWSCSYAAEKKEFTASQLQASLIKNFENINKSTAKTHINLMINAGILKNSHQLKNKLSGRLIAVYKFVSEQNTPDGVMFLQNLSVKRIKNKGYLCQASA